MGPVTPHPTAVARRASRLVQLTLPLFVAIALAVAMLAAPSTNGASSDAPALDLRSRQIPSAQLTTFTLNVCFCLTAAQAEADMAKALTLGEVGGFQEFSDLEDRQTLMRLATAKDYGWWMPATGGGETIPIVWNRARFRLIDGQTIKVHDRVDDNTPARYINVVRLREIATGKVFGIINTHTIAQASYDAQLTDPKRIPYLQKHIGMLRDAITGLFATTEHVFAMGDLNVNYLADRVRKNPGLPTATLGDLVNFDMPLTGSRGPTSLLDYGMTVKEDGGLTLLKSRVEYGFNSDHDAVVFDYGTVDLFATGGVFNRPPGTANEKREVLARAMRAIGNAEPGARIRLAVQRFDETEMMNALIAAYQRGVAVQVVLAEGTGTYAEQTLAATIGSDTLQPSWVKKCVGSCLGGAGRSETNMLLVSRSGGASEVTLAFSAMPTGSNTSSWTDAFLTTDSAVYAGYNATFDQMAADTVDTRASRSVRYGTAYSALLFPAAAGAKDPMLKVLKRVKCKTGKNVVRVSVAAWQGKRGKALAQQLVLMKERGCDVRAVLGKQVKKAVTKILTKGGIRFIGRPVAQNTLFVKGKWGGSAVTRAWVAGPGWTDKALGADGVALVVNDKAAKGYLKAFYRTWKGK